MDIIDTLIEEKYPQLIDDSTIGLDCESGWNSIVLEFCERVKDSGIKIQQIKEKFACLTIYVNYGDITSIEKDVVDNALKWASKEASKTCEICGTKENVAKRGGGWIKTLCPKCDLKR